MNYIVVAEFECPGEVGIGTGTTHAESLLVDLGAREYGIQQTITSVSEINQLGIAMDRDVALVSDILFLFPFDGLHREHPEYVRQARSKVRNDKVALDRFSTLEYRDQIESYIKKDLTGASYRNGSMTNPIMNTYPTLHLNGFAFLVSSTKIEAIQKLLTGSRFGKQFTQRIDRVHVYPTKLDPIRTAGGSPLRPFSPEQAKIFKISHGLPLWMGTGISRRSSPPGWMWTGEVRPLIAGDACDSEVTEQIATYCVGTYGEPIFDLPQMRRPHDALFSICDYERAALPEEWMLGTCGVTGQESLVRVKITPEQSGHEISRPHDGIGVVFFRRKEIQKSLGISNSVFGPLVVIGASKNVHTFGEVGPASAMTGSTKMIPHEPKEKFTTAIKLYAGHAPRVIVDVPDNKIDRYLKDVRWSVGRIVHDNVSSDFNDFGLISEFRSMGKNTQMEIAKRLGFSQRENPTMEATAFIRANVSRITDRLHSFMRVIAKEG